MTSSRNVLLLRVIAFLARLRCVNAESHTNATRRYPACRTSQQLDRMEPITAMKPKEMLKTNRKKLSQVQGLRLYTDGCIVQERNAFFALGKMKVVIHYFIGCQHNQRRRGPGLCNREKAIGAWVIDSTV